MTNVPQSTILNALRDGVENDLKKLGGTLRSRQVQALITTLARVIDTQYAFIEELEERIEKLEAK